MNYCGSYCLSSISCLRNACFFYISLSITNYNLSTIIHSQQAITTILILLLNCIMISKRIRSEPTSKAPLVLQINCEPFTQSMVDAEQLARKRDRLKTVDPYFLECYKLKDLIEQHEFGYFFKWPVNPYTLGLANYWTIIRKPMDLKTIGHKILFHLYSKPSNFDKDVRLMFNNALIYNDGNTEIIAKIKALAAFYQQKYEETRQMFAEEVVISENQQSRIISSSKLNLKVQQLHDRFFTQSRLKELGRRLSLIGQQGRGEIRKQMRKKFPDLNITSDNLILTSLSGTQLIHLVEVANNYEQQSYRCSREALQKFKPPNRPSKGMQPQEEQSSFEIEDEA